MEKKSKRVIFLQVLLVVFFASLLFYIRVVKEYNESFSAITEKVMAGVNEGYSVRNLKVNKTMGSPTDIVASVAPGSSFKGTFVVKNHNPTEGTYILFDNGFKKAAESQIGGDLEFIKSDKVGSLTSPGLDQEKDLVLNLSEKNVVLKPKEWKVIEYEILVPESFAPGVYQNVVAMRDGSVYKKDGFNMVFSVGVEMVVEVTDTPREFVYENLIQDNISVASLAKKAAINEFWKILGVVFVGLSVIFLYLAFQENKKQA